MDDRKMGYSPACHELFEDMPGPYAEDQWPLGVPVRVQEAYEKAFAAGVARLDLMARRTRRTVMPDARTTDADRRGF